MQQTRKFYHGIHSLRGLVALAVVLFHARNFYNELPEWADWGNYGVEIFFVISGFVLAHTSKSLPETANRLAVARGFFWRRLMRLLPLYWLTLFIAAAPWIIAWLGSADSLRSLYWNFGPWMKSLLLDLLFIPHAHPRFPDKLWPLVVPGWTLNLEMFFYLVFSVSLITRRFNLELACLLIFFLFIVGTLQPFDNKFVSFFTQSRVLYFPMGIMVFLLAQKNSPISISPIVWWLLIAGSILFFGFLAGHYPRLGLMAPTAGVILLLAASAPLALKSRVLALLGDSSYAIYLLHTVVAFPLVHWMFRVVGLEDLRFTADVSFSNTAPVMFFHVLVSAIVGVLGHKLLEKPLTEGARTLSARLFIRAG